MTRKLTTIRTVTDILPILDADAIEVAQIDGWQVVVKKGEFKIGDQCVYFEIDSLCPIGDTRFEFLKVRSTTRNSKHFECHRLRTVKLRGVYSQGLVLPLYMFPELINVDQNDEEDILSVILGIEKWEPSLPASLCGKVKGNFPSFIRKTDQERWSNLTRDHTFAAFRDLGIKMEVSEKLDGSSCTVYLNDGNFGVCSRNLELKLDSEDAFVTTAKRLGLEEKFHSLGKNFAFQGELIGPGIQKNRYNRKFTEWYVFDIYDIDRGVYLEPKYRQKICEQLGLTQVPILGEFTIIEAGNMNEFSEGKSVLNPNTLREGVVFKGSFNGSGGNMMLSFKAISPKFLLKTED
jgi:RNA ligase (TIGR02306 family)